MQVAVLVHMVILAFVHNMRPSATKGTLRRENENSFLMNYA